jgi:hypothetical protein
MRLAAGRSAELDLFIEQPGVDGSTVGIVDATGAVGARIE